MEDQLLILVSVMWFTGKSEVFLQAGDQALLTSVLSRSYSDSRTGDGKKNQKTKKNVFLTTNTGINLITSGASWRRFSNKDDKDLVRMESHRLTDRES